MNNTKLKDVDIFHRTLFCQPMPDKKENIESLETTEATSELEAEEEVFIPEEETINPKRLLRELECIKLRIRKVQHLLKMKIDECPKEKCKDYEELLNCSENKEICDLQKNQHLLQYQIKEILECFKVGKGEIQGFHEQINDKNKEIADLKEEVAALTEWRNSVKHEFGKCRERFEYLKHVKAERKDVNEKVERQ